MTVQPFTQPSLPAPVPQTVPGTLATTPTGAPVPAATGEGFLALLLAALPSAPPVITDPPATDTGPVGHDGDPGVPGCCTEEPAEGAVPGESPAPELSVELATLALGVPVALRAAAAPQPTIPVVGPTATVEGAVTTAPTTGPAGSSDESVALPLTGQAVDPAAAGHATSRASDTGAPGAFRLPEGLVPVEAGGALETQPGGQQAPAGQPQATPADGPVAVPSAITSPASPAGPAPVAMAAATPADGPAPAQVAQQVFPEVGRLVTRGDGTHRLTLTLNPAALGDVQVTLTVRGGAVTVTFAATDQAQAALLEGAPELRRLLESVGAQETRVLVRDLSAATTSATPAATDAGSTAQERSSGPGAEERSSGPGADAQGREAPTDKHARTRADQLATDGATRGPGTFPPAQDPAARRPGGVDVTV